MPVSRQRKKKPRGSTARSQVFLLETDGLPVQCSGVQLDHADGSMSCTRGHRCAGIALSHRGWRDCRLLGPCPYCDRTAA